LALRDAVTSLVELADLLPVVSPPESAVDVGTELAGVICDGRPRNPQSVRHLCTRVAALEQPVHSFPSDPWRGEWWATALASDLSALTAVADLPESTGVVADGGIRQAEPMSDLVQREPFLDKGGDLLAGRGHERMFAQAWDETLDWD
jgi:hypothetical protein